MALFEYFPNYVWNLSVAIALESGGKIGEIVEMCQPVRDAAARGTDTGTPQFLAHWIAMANKLIELADEDDARGRRFSASDKLERAALYLLVAERMQAQGSPGREATYARARTAFDRSTSLGQLNRERVEIPPSTGTMCLKRWPGAVSPRYASISRAPERRCGFSDCPSIRTAKTGPRGRWTGCRLGATLSLNALA